MTASRATRPAYGKRLIPHIIDELASSQPEQEAFQIPRSSDPKDGWKVVTWKDYANAVNHVAHRIIELCGTPEDDAFPTIAYLGQNDARYVVMMVGAIKAGYKALFISPRNSQEGQINLFERSDCDIIIYPKSQRKTVQPWLEERHMKAIEVGEMDRWFPKEQVPHFPYEKTYEQAEWDPVVVLHTSGSTGFPKPVIARVGMLSVGDAWNELPDFQGAKFIFNAWAEQSKRIFLPMPLFHAAALYSFINLVIYRTTPIALSVDNLLSTDLVVESLNNVSVDSTLLPPAILEDMSQEDVYTDALKKLKHVVFGGGNLVREAGNRLVEKSVPIVNAIAATEACPWPYYLQPNPELWQYFIINSHIMGAEWRRTEEEGVYEQVIVRQGKAPGDQGFFFTFPEEKEYRTKDLYKPHPVLPDHWIYYGRADNIIVFSNGEKLNPVSIEETISDHSAVKGAVVVGSNKFQPGLLIEPLSHPENEKEEEELLESIWPTVVKANEQSVAHGRIGRRLIMLTSPDKPFPRAGKGTIQRAGAIKLYNDEIDKLYENSSELSEMGTPHLDATSEDTLTNSIVKLFESLLESPHLDPDSDFFSAGIDSMQVINSIYLIRAGLQAAGHEIQSNSLKTRVVYGNPTPRKLARYLLQTYIHPESKDERNGTDDPQLVMKHLHEKYTLNLATSKEGRGDASDTDQTVILTGSTGMLGSYLLDQALRDNRVKKVICLNRAEDGGVKQQQRAMKERGLTTSYQDKTEFHHADMSRPHFGLPRKVYDHLLEVADRWIHNAWPVNFNLTVETFEPHLHGVRNVADFATRAAKRVAVVFISSIGTTDLWDTAKGPIPEKHIDDLSIASTGYAQSKLVGSMILEDASKAGDFPAAVIRVGQIAGPESEAGAWNRQEWLPSIIASSLHLKTLPSDLGSMSRVDWTPSERVASLVLEILGVTQSVNPEDISGYYHGVNPSHTTWQNIAPAVQEFYGKEKLPELVSFQEWVERLEKTETEDIAWIDANPGIKLLDSYKGMAAGKESVVFDTQRTTKQSPTLRDTKAVTAELMKHWCAQWGFGQ